MVCHNLIFDLKLWSAYKGAFLILEKLFSRSSFYDTAFLILAGGQHLDASISTENILRRSSIDVIIFNCGLLA